MVQPQLITAYWPSYWRRGGEVDFIMDDMMVARNDMVLEKDAGGVQSSGSEMAVPVTRKEFPETWIWDELLNFDRFVASIL